MTGGHHRARPGSQLSPYADDFPFLFCLHAGMGGGVLVLELVLEKTYVFFTPFIDRINLVKFLPF